MLDADAIHAALLASAPPSPPPTVPPPTVPGPLAPAADQMAVEVDQAAAMAAFQQLIMSVALQNPARFCLIDTATGNSHVIPHHVAHVALGTINLPLGGLQPLTMTDAAPLSAVAIASASSTHLPSTALAWPEPHAPATPLGGATTMVSPDLAAGTFITPVTLNGTDLPLPSPPDSPGRWTISSPEELKLLNQCKRGLLPYPPEFGSASEWKLFYKYATHRGIEGKWTQLRLSACLLSSRVSQPPETVEVLLALVPKDDPMFSFTVLDTQRWVDHVRGRLKEDENTYGKYVHLASVKVNKQVVGDKIKSTVQTQVAWLPATPEEEHRFAVAVDGVALHGVPKWVTVASYKTRERAIKKLANDVLNSPSPAPH
ncbi:hypothetical protein BCR44DRAFT_72226 [Catenaria anguillulae PL171]|uniref:Uncharacterized protein n=1 Tax=Catenaria anguillulae PL171 TaxID=765915 RepID=A0A1Y2HTS8_9FUNG|nr:hypothetical protein BCR44DRAFT_72226 [Catenaria anguillulae PL171]